MTCASSARIHNSDLRVELGKQFLQPNPGSDQEKPGELENLMRNLDDARLRLTGQNGISDYDVGFTNFLLHTFERNSGARHPFPPAGALWSATPC
jgi:hypothetical protein